MKMNSKGVPFVSSVVMILATAGLLAGCGEKGPSLVVSAAADQDEWLRGELAKFNEQREKEEKPTVRFEVVAHGEDAVDSEVLDWRSGPDVYTFASDKIMPLYQMGALAKVPSDNVDWIKREMGDKVLAAAYFAKKYVAYPYQHDNGYFLYYDKTKLSSTDVETMGGLLTKLNEIHGKLSYPLSDAFYSMGAFFTFGSDYHMEINNDGKITKIEADFDDERNIAVTKALYKILHHNAFIGTPLGPDDGVYASINGTWKAKAYMGENIVCTKLPSIEGTIEGEVVSRVLGSFLGYKMLGVNPMRSSLDNDIERLALAHEVAKYLSSKEVQKSRFEKFSYGPSNSELKKSPEVQNDPVLAGLREQERYSHVQTAMPAGLWNAASQIIEALKKAAAEPNDRECLGMLKEMNDRIVESK